MDWESRHDSSAPPIAIIVPCHNGRATVRQVVTNFRVPALVEPCAGAEPGAGIRSAVPRAQPEPRQRFALHKSTAEERRRAASGDPSRARRSP